MEYYHSCTKSLATNAVLCYMLTRTWDYHITFSWNNLAQRSPSTEVIEIVNMNAQEFQIKAGYNKMPESFS